MFDNQSKKKEKLLKYIKNIIVRHVDEWITARIEKTEGHVRIAVEFFIYTVKRYASISPNEW